MAIKPWMTSDDLISAVKRKIAIPINQRTFSEEDILAFANEEMMSNQVPDILMYHEEYFVYSEDITMVPNQTRYPIPERAIGQKLRDLFYVDSNLSLYEMTRISADDKAYWQRDSALSNLSQKYYIEGNDIVLAPKNVSSPTGYLRFSYFLRPNQLVLNARAAISKYFFKNITVDNTTLNAGDTLTIGDLVFTAVVGAPAALEFQIGANSIDSATNLVTAISTDNTYIATNGSPASNIVQVKYTKPSTLVIASDTAALSISDEVGIQFTADLPDNIVDGINIDFLQTKPGHKTMSFGVNLPAGSVSTDSIIFASGVIPSTFVIGDYVCQEYECIIPQIPSDLHNGLAERVCARILSAQGDMQGLQMNDVNVQAIKKAEGSLIDNRVDGSTQKVNQRKTLLSYLRMGIRRRI